MANNKIEFDIQGMTCESCATHVERALQRVEGVVSVEVPGWESNQAKVITNGEVNQLDLMTAVNRAGYQANIKSATEKKITDGSNGSGGDWDYDLIVIGTGGGGVAAVIKAAELGFNAAVIEGGVIGGTCVNIGCVPSKTLIRAAESYYNAGHNPFEGAETRPVKLDWGTLIQRKDELVTEMRQSKYIDVLGMYADNVTLIEGWATLQPDGKVALADGRVFTANKIVIATGARPNVLPIDGIDQVKVLNSTTAMALSEQPESLIVIGGRAVALELGQTFARLGTKVTVLQRSARLVPEHEPEISDALKDILQDEGIDVYTNTSLVEIKEEDGQKIILAEVDGKPQEFRAEQVLMAVGRTPNTQDLGLSSLGIELDDKGFIKVNDQMETTNPNFYAVGDVSNRPKFVYVAAAAGGIAAENALTNGSKLLDLTSLPEVIFTNPQIASVGLTESQAIEQGHEIKTSVVPMEYVPRALAARDTRGVIKLVADSNTDRLLGVHILAPEAGEMIQTGTLAIKFGLTVSDLKGTLFPYLTNVEGLKLAALAFEKDVAMLSCCAG